MVNRCNTKEVLNSLLDELPSFWERLLREAVSKPKVIAKGVPSIELDDKLTREMLVRYAKQQADLGEEGLAKMQKILDESIEQNERPAPEAIFEDFKVPSIKSISFHNVNVHNDTYRGMDLTKLGFQTTFCDVLNSEFAYFYGIFDTTNMVT